MRRYENGKIYKIVDNGYNMCYIGCTCESLSQRMARHRHHYNSYLKGNHGKTRSFDIFDKYDITNCKIELVENYPCNNKDELRRREGFYIQNTECINKHIAGRTPQEYRDATKEHKHETDKVYRENNMEKLKAYREERKEHYQEYNKNWKQDNKEHVKKYNSEWRQNNKQKVSEKATCEKCGAIVTKYDMKTHQQTKKCSQRGENGLKT